jgi:hypothetical protein
LKVISAQLQSIPHSGLHSAPQPVRMHHPRPCRRLLLGGLLLASLALASACGGGGGGSDPTAVSPSPAPLAPPANPESGPEAIGVFAGFTGDPAWSSIVTGVQGDGGVGAGSDGGGGVGAGGSLGQFRNALVYATLDDGTRLGPAVTDSANGMVTIRPGRSYAGSLLVELVGQGGSEYFDEAKGGWIAFPAGQRLRAHVDAIRSNIGITPLSEAAVAHADADPQLAGLPPAERAKQANERIRGLINSQLPTSYAVDDVATLPVLLNPSSGKGALPDTPAGRYGSVIAALAFVGSQFNPPLAAPGLSIATQLARDLTDGRLDGAGPGGAALAPADQLSYESTQLPGDLVAAIDRVNTRYGVDSGNPPLPQVAEFGRYQAQGTPFTARLMSDGRVLVASAGAPETPLPSDPSLPATSLPATALFSDGAALLVRRVDGSMQGVGTNPFPRNTEPPTFRFGVATTADAVVPVAAAAALSQADGATGIVFGTAHGLARTADGRALAWGDNSGGQLGLGDVGAQVAPVSVALPAGVRSVAASLDFSLALLTDGRVISWGSERQGALGRGANAVFEQAPDQVVTASGEALRAVVAILATNATSIALRTDGSVWGWGLATEGLLGDEQAPLRYTAAPVNGLSAIRKVVPVQGGLVALDQSGAVLYWGTSGTAGQVPVLPSSIGGLPRIRDLQDRGAGNVVALGFGDEVFSIGAFGAVAQ